MNKPNKIILHHSLTDGGTLESIRRYHIEHNGWKDIGYHYLITTDGRLHKGRDEKATGAHCLGENDTSIGICLVGNFDKYEPKEEQITSLNVLLHSLKQRLGITEIQGHNHYSPKTCPGIKFSWNKLIDLEDKKELDQCSDWAKDAQSWVIENDISDGVRPKDTATREEIWTMIYRLLKL